MLTAKKEKARNIFEGEGITKWMKIINYQNKKTALYVIYKIQKLNCEELENDDSKKWKKKESEANVSLG